MKNFYLPFVLFLASTLLLEAQPKRNFYSIFCSTMEDGNLFGLEAHDIMTSYITEVTRENEEVRHISRDLTFRDFNLKKVRELIRELSRDSTAIIFFHLYDHGKNRGGALPAINCYDERSRRTDFHLDIEKEILQPLSSFVKKGFVLINIDACNQLLATPSGREPVQTTYSNNGYDVDGILTIYKSAGKKSIKEIKKPFQVSRDLKKNPLGLMLSSRGYLAVVSSSPGESAFIRKGSSGIGTVLFFEHLSRHSGSNDKDRNWLGLLFEYWETVINAARALPKAKQTPYWFGKIDDTKVPLAKDLFLPGERLTRADSTQFFKPLKIDTSELLEKAYDLTRQFCNLTNSGVSLRGSLKNICVPYNKLIMFDALKLADSGMGDYINYRKFCKQRINRYARFIPNTLFFEDFYIDVKSDQLLLGFQVECQLSRSFWDTTFQQLIVVKISPRKKRKEMALGPKLEISRVLNLPGDAQEDKAISPEDVPERDTIAEKKRIYQNAETAFKMVGDSLIHELFRLIIQSASGEITLDIAVDRANEIFRDSVNTIEVSRINTDSYEILPPFQASEYFGRFWDLYPLHYGYDSVSFSYCWLKPVISGASESLIEEVGDEVWKGSFEFAQLFRAYRSGKEVITDTTIKKIEVFIKRVTPEGDIPSDNDRFLIKLGDVSVVSTRPTKDCNTSQHEKIDHQN